MDNYPHLLFKAFKNAWGQKSIWLLGFIQIFCLFLVLRKLEPVWWHTPFGIIQSLAQMLIFSVASVILWLKIQAFDAQQVFFLPLEDFRKISTRLFALLALGVVFAIFLKALRFHWTFFALFSSVAAVSFASAMLAAALYRLDFNKSLNFMLDFWRHKISVICIGAFAVMLGNAYAFYFAHALWPQTMVQSGGFSVSDYSATIWIVFLAFAGVAAFFSAVLNAFLVLIFLDITRPKKAAEKLENAVIQPATIV